MSKEGFKIEIEKTLENYKNSIIDRNLLYRIQLDLSEVLNTYLSNNVVMSIDFPIKFENDLGKWEFHNDGKTFFSPNIKLDYIEHKVIISPTNN
jgi:hypothetical protein